MMIVQKGLMTEMSEYGLITVGDSYHIRIAFNTTTLVVDDDEYDDSDACNVYGDDWLGYIATWVYNNMDSSTYDNVQFITDIKFSLNYCTYGSTTYVCSRTLGWGNIGVVCSGPYSVSFNSVVEDFGGNENAIGTIAHELGHNFGLYHDGQSGPAYTCGADDGLMGYGTTDDVFSTCSLDSMQDYYEGDGNGLACLGTGWDNNFISNVGDASDVTPAPTTKNPTVDPNATPAPTPPTPAPTQPTPSPTYAAADGCLSVDIGYTNFFIETTFKGNEIMLKRDHKSEDIKTYQLLDVLGKSMISGAFLNSNLYLHKQVWEQNKVMVVNYEKKLETFGLMLDALNVLFGDITLDWLKQDFDGNAKPFHQKLEKCEKKLRDAQLTLTDFINNTQQKAGHKGAAKFLNKFKDKVSVKVFDNQPYRDLIYKICGHASSMQIYYDFLTKRRASNEENRKMLLNDVKGITLCMASFGRVVVHDTKEFLFAYLRRGAKNIYQ